MRRGGRPNGYTNIIYTGQKFNPCRKQAFKIISDPTRISILFLLQQQELSVGAITISLEMEQSAISHQLRTLKEARLVKARREGKTIFYSLDDIHVFSILEQVLTHVKEIEDLEESEGQ